MNYKYKNLTISGKIAVGSTTLAKSLQEILDWKYINTGALQRKFDRMHGINEHQQGATARSDEHEESMEEKAKHVLETEEQVIYEAWLSGFIARDMEDVLKVLLICSNVAIRIDRVVNREGLNVEDSKQFIKQREEENTSKWIKLYGDYDFWDPKYYDLVINTYSSGPLETVGKVLDKLGYKGEF